MDTTWTSHNFSKPAELTAGCVRWSALYKSMLTAAVQPEEPLSLPPLNPVKLQLIFLLEEDTVR